MLPHPETAIAVVDLRYQELLRDAAKQRRITSAQASAPSFLARAKTASPVAALWPRVRQFLAAQLRPRRCAPLSQRPGFDVCT
jgi:hypothetical protein